MTTVDVSDIKYYLKQGHRRSEIATRFGCSRQAVSLIANGHTHGAVKAARSAPPLGRREPPYDLAAAESRARMLATIREKQAAKAAAAAAKPVPVGRGWTGVWTLEHRRIAFKEIAAKLKAMLREKDRYLPADIRKVAFQRDLALQAFKQQKNADAAEAEAELLRKRRAEEEALPEAVRQAKAILNRRRERRAIYDRIPHLTEDREAADREVEEAERELSEAMALHTG